LHENGIRVPLIVRWPGVTGVDQVSEQMVTGMDISATILAAAGAKPDPRHPLDGDDLRPVLAGEKPLYSRKFFWRHHGWPRPGIPEQGALRHGNWKYYVSGEYERLYDLSRDEMELNDLSAVEADRFAQMRREYQAWAAQMLPYDDVT
jgi:arylsulfatase A-like enzyme